LAGAAANPNQAQMANPSAVAFTAPAIAPQFRIDICTPQNKLRGVARIERGSAGQTKSARHACDPPSMHRRQNAHNK
jgi:hypothetical protein